jgi:hypothetical protein
VDGSEVVTATVLMNSTASGAKMFQAAAYIGGVIVKTDTVWVEVIAAGATATPTTGPLPTPGGGVRLVAGKWYSVSNAAKKEELCLYVVSGGGHVWKHLELPEREPSLNVVQYVAYKDVPGWFCVGATTTWGKSVPVPVVWFVCDSEIVISECWLRTFAEMSSMSGGIACEVRG